MIITQDNKKYLKITVNGNIHLYDLDYVEGFLMYDPEQEDDPDFDGRYGMVSFGEYVLEDGSLSELIKQVEEIVPEDEIFWTLERENFSWKI